MSFGVGLSLALLTDFRFSNILQTLVGVPHGAETVYSGSVEPDQVRTCEGNNSCHFGKHTHGFLAFS